MKKIVSQIVGLIVSLCLFKVNAFTSESLENKVGQLLIVHFQGEIANEEAQRLIQESKVGGFIYYGWANGLHSKEQVRYLSDSLQELAAKNGLPPLLIVIDQEGGRVARLRSGFTMVPSNRVLGQTKNPQLAEEMAYTIGRELKAVGINMNLAPVVDVDSNELNPVIGDRSFSRDPHSVANFGQKALDGYKRSGTIACLKHFPGHGDVTVDSHYGLPLLDKPLEALKQVELVPFAKLVRYADVVMTGHLLVPAFDAENCTTLSKKTLDYLRCTLGFSGAIMTDSLVMAGVLKQCQTVDEAAIQALNAGCDLLLLGGQLLTEGNVDMELNSQDVKRIHASLVNAVKNGRIAEERIDSALEKINRLKNTKDERNAIGNKNYSIPK
ncbi:MAG: beta-N-acetylhexosaminidase [Parachlamydiaceae bacterium]